MSRLRTAATIASALAVGNLALVLAKRHEELVGLLDEIARGLGAPECDKARNDIPDIATPSPPAPTAAVLYGPRTTKIVEIRADGTSTIHASHGAKWAAVARVARLTGDVDVDALEQRMLAAHKGVKKIGSLPAKQVNQATSKLLDTLTTTPTQGGRA